MNPRRPVRLQGHRIAFPGYLPWNPGSAIPVRRTAEAVAALSGPDLADGQATTSASADRYVHIKDDHTFGAYANAVEALNTTSTALLSLNNLVPGQIARFQTAINPTGFPGGTYVTPVELPSFTSFNRYNEFALYVQDNWSFGDRLTLNLGLRYEYFGPQKKSEPKFDSNFYYGDPNVVGQHERAAGRSSPRIAHRQVLPTEREPDRRALEVRLEQLRAARRLRLGRERRRQDQPPRRLRHRATNGTSATSPTTCCSTRPTTSWPRSTRRTDVPTHADLHR